MSGPVTGAERAPRQRLLVAVFVGGALGTLVRAALSEAIGHDDPTAWPWATLAVNVVGAFLVGRWAHALRDPDVDPRLRPFLLTGVCGGLTTFATLQLELVELARADAWWTAAAYATASVVLGLAAVLAGRRSATDGDVA